MRLFIGVVLCWVLATVNGENCENIGGKWRNQLGSNMSIVHWADDRFTGEYSTAVESRADAAINPSNITGLYKTTKGGGLLSFTVLFNHGKSLTTWVGQCMVCDGEEKLFTTWVLRTHQQYEKDRWMATRINQDTFQRVKTEDNSNVPRHLSVSGPLQKEIRSESCEQHLEANSNGKWVRHEEDHLGFTNCYKNGIISGSHLKNQFVGRSLSGSRFRALGFLSSSSNQQIHGWAGHMRDGLNNIESSWISHIFSNTCKDPRRFVKFEFRNYAYDSAFEEQKPSDGIIKTIMKYPLQFLKYIGIL